MGWADHHIAALKEGRTVKFRPRGSSMEPIVKSGQLVTVEPVDGLSVKVGDAVLCRVAGRDYLHLVKAVSGERVQIGNNRGHVNGWTHAKNVYGKLVKVEP